MSVYRFGDWLVEPELSRIRRGQENRHLEPKALEVLLCLLEHPGEVISQERLLKTVWNGRVVETSAVARNIASLRRVLKDEARRPRYIETVPKRGYRAIAPVDPLVLQSAAPGSGRREQAKILAVLPFENLSAEPANAFFAAGIHAEVSNKLGTIKDLSVIARTTMLRYVGSDRTLPEIGAELNVDAVLEGSVRYDDDRVRINVQLSDASSGAQLWSEAYQGNLTDVFGIQLAVATEIARALEARLTSSEQARISGRSTDNPRAYARYLQALSGWGNYAPTGPMHAAIDAAIAADPQFADALAYKAFLHAMEASVGSPFIETRFDRESQRRLAASASKYAYLALEIDNAQARPYWALASIQRINRQWETSLQNFQRAYSLDPNDYILLNGAAWASLSEGDIDTGVHYMQRSVALNPGDIANHGNCAAFLYDCQRWEEAEQQAILVAALAPESPAGYVMLALVASHLGDFDAVRANAAMAEAHCAGLPDARIATAYGRIGDRAQARRIADALEASTIELNAWTKFWLSMAASEPDRAMDHLKQAIHDGFPWVASRDLHFLSGHPKFDPVRDHPKFNGLVQRTGVRLDSR